MAALKRCIIQFKVTDPRPSAGVTKTIPGPQAVTAGTHTRKEDTFYASDELTIDLTGDVVTLTGVGTGAAADPTKFPRENLIEYYTA